MSTPTTLLLIFLCLASASVALAEEAPMFILKWGIQGSGVGEFDRTYGVAVDAEGSVYVSDFGNFRIQKFTPRGAFITTWGSNGNGEGQFATVSRIAIDQEGYVYVSDKDNNRIQKFTSDGTFVLMWGGYGSIDGLFRGAWGLAFDPANNLYVVDRQNNRIQKFTSDGTFLSKWGTFGSDDGQFVHPFGIAVSADSRVYVADTNNHRVQVFTSDGVFISKLGVDGTGEGQLSNPLGISIDSAGDIYVVEEGGNRIQKFTRDGVYLTHWGSLGFGDGQFNRPWDICVDASDHIYVADGFNHRIQRFGPPLSITRILDVPSDQGRQVRINFLRAAHDTPDSLLSILQYEVFRRIKTQPKSTSAGAHARPTLADWEQVGSISAHGETEYNIVVPTLADSTVEHGIRWSEFFIRAATADPFTFFDSASDSGYSIDNLAPGVPEGFGVVALSGDGDMELNWGESEDHDFRYFTLYRGSEPHFIPAEETLVAQLTETSYVDNEAPENGWPLYYKLSATDFAGNEGPFAETHSAIVDVQHLDFPNNFALLPSAPNPVSGQGSIRFQLSTSTDVTLRIYDARGRIIRNAIEGTILLAGHHEWVWDLRDKAGVRVPAGMYLYRLETPQSSQTQKIVVVD